MQDPHSLETTRRMGLQNLQPWERVRRTRSQALRTRRRKLREPLRARA